MVVGPGYNIVGVGVSKKSWVWVEVVGTRNLT